MKALILILALLSVAAQDPWRPGDGTHREPPEGWFCQRQSLDESVPRDHVCGCIRLCEKAENGELIVREDPKCSSYCFKAHCQCGGCAKDSH